MKEEEGQEESKVEEEDEKVPDEAEIKEKGLKFDEYSIETDIEQANVTQFYLKESQRLKNLPKISKK